MRRVVVTGMGIASPLGLGVERVWKRLINGESGIGSIQSFDTTELTAKIAGQVPPEATLRLKSDPYQKLAGRFSGNDAPSAAVPSFSPHIRQLIHLGEHAAVVDRADRCGAVMLPALFHRDEEPGIGRGDGVLVSLKGGRERMPGGAVRQA